MILSQWLENEKEMVQEEGWTKGLEAGRKAGMEEGMEAGRKEGEKYAIVEIVCKKLANGMLSENIADFLQEDVEYINKIKEIGEKTTPKYNIDQVFKYMEMQKKLVEKL